MSVEARSMAHPRKTKERGAARARARTGTESAPDAAGAAAGVNGANLLTFSAAVARARPGTACACWPRAIARASETYFAATTAAARTKGLAALLSFVNPLGPFLPRGSMNLTAIRPYKTTDLVRHRDTLVH